MFESNIEEIAKAFNKLPDIIQNSVNNSVKIITNNIYNDIVINCENVNLENHISNIDVSFLVDKGIISTDDNVIVYHEFGTGIVGKNSSKPLGFEGWEYDINNHGQEGWRYPKKDGTYGITRGLPTQAMFYNSYIKNKDKTNDIVNSNINYDVRKLY